DAETEDILAVNATVEGQPPAHNITDLLAGSGVGVSRLAHGVPVGGEHVYLEVGTLAAAMRQRQPF
ncbi:MAG: recombination protein RecR, partial [Flavobacteriaceae bacterium]